MHHSDGFKGVFYLLLLSVPLYARWQQQQAARRARARLNGALAKNTKLASAYIIGHNGIQVQKGQGLFTTLRTQSTFCPLVVICSWQMCYQASQIHKAMHRVCKAKHQDLTTHVNNLSLK